MFLEIIVVGGIIAIWITVLLYAQSKYVPKHGKESLTTSNSMLEQDRIANPHLALISDHLYWIAFVAKIGLLSTLISLFLMIVMYLVYT